MSPYQHPGPEVAATKQSIRQQLANLRRLEAAIHVEELAKEQYLSGLYRERRIRHRAGSYTPSAEALAYRDKYADVIASQPRPIHGGPAGLRRAADEMEEHEARKRKAA